MKGRWIHAAALRTSVQNLEHRAGVEPANTGFADLRVSHFATDAHQNKLLIETGY
jgi:hypothetical protein